MVDLVTVGFVLAGVVLLFAGAALSVYAVVVLGTLLGSGGGYLLAPTVAPALGLEGVLAVAIAVVLGAVAGGVLGYLLLSFTITLLSFVVGSFLGHTVLSPLFVSGEWYVEVGFAVAVGVAAALVATLLTRTMLIVVTSVVGASLASTSLTLAEFQTAHESVTLEPLLFDATSPIFVVLVVLGILSQLGLFTFGYVTRLAAVLPGARTISDRRGRGRRRDDAEST